MQVVYTAFGLARVRGSQGEGCNESLIIPEMVRSTFSSTVPSRTIANRYSRCAA